MLELQSLLHTLQNPGLLDLGFFDFDHSAALHERDADPFDTEWMRIHRELKEVAISAEHKELLAEIRKAAFLSTMEATKNSELAGYISDDFDLLGRGLIADAADPWLNGLWVTYCEEKFPCGELKPRAGKLRELFNEMLWDD